MSIVEKAGGSVHSLPIRKKRQSQTQSHASRSFELDYNRLKSLGLYQPEMRDARLALELRAIKRRLLRRLGYLRASGDRQSYRMPGRQRNLIMVTSTRAGEGKSFSAVNLALSLAIEDNIETLLVDADIPRPKVRQHFGLEPGKGFSDKLLDPALSIESVQHRAQQAPLSVLPEGSTVERIADLYAGDHCQTLLTALSAQIRDRLIILDAPPVLSTTEAVILAKYVDEIIFVVEANTTPEPAAASAIDELLEVNPNVSLVLNRCLIGAGGSHYGSYEYYGQTGEKSERRPTGPQAED